MGPGPQGAGLPDTVHLHDLRHAGATLSAQLGATTKELMARLGHASPRAALIYQRAADGRDRVLADRLEELAAATRSDSPRHRSREVPRDARAMEGNSGSEVLHANANNNGAEQGFREVETMGLEPTTPCLQSRCSTS